MNNETPTIKLTGHFNKTFSVRREEDGYKGLEYSFEWDFNEKQTRIPVSPHAAIELTATFIKLGFTQIHPKGYNKFMKKTYRVPCSWEVYGSTEVEAESWEEAISKSEDAPLPSDGSYIEGSFRIDEELIEFEKEKEFKL